MFLYNLLPLSSGDPEGIGMAYLGQERPHDHLHPGGMKPLTFLECWKKTRRCWFLLGQLHFHLFLSTFGLFPTHFMLPRRLFLGSLAYIQLYFYSIPVPFSGLTWGQPQCSLLKEEQFMNVLHCKLASFKQTNIHKESLMRSHAVNSQPSAS